MKDKQLLDQLIRETLDNEVFTSVGMLRFTDILINRLINERDMKYEDARFTAKNITEVVIDILNEYLNDTLTNAIMNEIMNRL